MRAAAALWLLVALARGAAAEPKIGDRAPALGLPALDGDGAATVTTAGLKGRVRIVDFFATWCGPCHEAIADLSALLQAEGGAVSLTVVDVKEGKGEVARFVAERPFAKGVVVALDGNGEAARRWGQHRFPTTFVVDERGVIRHINRGYGPGYAERMKRWVGEMLAK